MNNDLISRSELKKAFEKVYPLATNEMGGVVNKQIYEIIDNAPTVEIATTLQPTCNNLQQKPQGEWAKGFHEGFNACNRLSEAFEERPQGEWKETGYETGALGITYRQTQCSNCGWEHALPMWLNFCPNCGAEMRRGDTNDNKV